MEPITIYYTIIDTGDGEARLGWHLSEKDIEISNPKQEYRYGEGSIETFIGPKTYEDAKSSSDILHLGLSLKIGQTLKDKDGGLITVGELPEPGQDWFKDTNGDWHFLSDLAEK